MSAPKPSVAIVGLGLIAQTHADAYRRLGDRVSLDVACDVDQARATSFAQAYGCEARFDVRTVIEDPAIDIVDVILPHHLHGEIAAAVLAAGKHLLLEKPVAGTYAESVAICRQAEEAGVHFMVAENTRYVAAYRAVERLVLDGAIGEVIHARTFLRSNEKIHLSQPGYWRTKYSLGGGLILDTGAHSFYLLKWLLGDIEELSAVSRKVFPLDNEIEDTAEVRGRMASGAYFDCGFTSVSEIPHSERLELFGTSGGLVVDQMADPVVKLFHGSDDYQGRAVSDVPFGPDGWHAGGWHYESVVAEVSDYVQSLVDGRPPLIDAWDCAYAIKAIEASYRSITEGTIVRLSES